MFFKTTSNLFKSALFLVLLVSTVMVGCKNNASHNDDSSAAKDTIEEADTTQIVKARKVFHSMPSPLQVSALLKQAGAKYVDKILNPPANANKYSTNYSKSLAVGVYSTDLAYANMFNQTQHAISYMEAIVKTSEGLGLTNLFTNSKVLKRFQDNMNNQDSLFNIIAELYRETDETLKENQQRNSASLILAGGWIEGLYISTSLAKMTPNKDMVNRIAELKFSLSALLSMLEDYQTDPEFASLLADLNGIKKVYEDIEMSYTKKDPSTDEKSQVTTLNSSSEGVISDAQLKELTEKANSLRSKIVKPN